MCDTLENHGENHLQNEITQQQVINMQNVTLDGLFSLTCITLNVKLIHGVKVANFSIYKKFGVAKYKLNCTVTWISINAVKRRKKVSEL